jgi:hypothetical protein
MCLGQAEVQCVIIGRRFHGTRQRRGNVRNALESRVDVRHPHPQVGSAGLYLENLAVDANRIVPPAIRFCGQASLGNVGLRPRSRSDGHPERGERGEKNRLRHLRQFRSLLIHRSTAKRPIVISSDINSA